MKGMETRDRYDSPESDIDKIERDMENGFEDLVKKVDEMDLDELRREVRLLMMIGHQQMAQIHLQRVEIGEMNREMTRRAEERSRVLTDVDNLCDALDVPFDQEYDSPHVALRHAIKRVERSEAQTLEGNDDVPRYIEVCMAIACIVFSACFLVWTILMLAAWVR